MLFYLVSCNSNRSNEIEADSLLNNNSHEKNDTISQQNYQKKQIIPEKQIETADKIDTLADSTLWKRYYQVRDQANRLMNSNSYNQAVEQLLKAAQYTEVLNKEGIAAWQYNNAGYCEILHFKKITNYQNRMNKINNRPNSFTGQDYIAETKIIFNNNLIHLERARKYLEKAYQLDEQFDKSERTEKIYNNLKFADWVCNYVKDR